MFKKLVSKAGKLVKTTSVAFMHGYNSVDTLEVVASIHSVEKKEVEITPAVEVS